MTIRQDDGRPWPPTTPARTSVNTTSDIATDRNQIPTRAGCPKSVRPSSSRSPLPGRSAPPTAIAAPNAALRHPPRRANGAISGPAVATDSRIGRIEFGNVPLRIRSRRWLSDPAAAQAPSVRVPSPVSPSKIRLCRMYSVMNVKNAMPIVASTSDRERPSTRKLAAIGASGLSVSRFSAPRRECGRTKSENSTPTTASPNRIAPISHS